MNGIVFFIALIGLASAYYDGPYYRQTQSASYLKVEQNYFAPKFNLMVVMLLIFLFTAFACECCGCRSRRFPNVFDRRRVLEDYYSNDDDEDENDVYEKFYSQSEESEESEEQPDGQDRDTSLLQSRENEDANIRHRPVTRSMSRQNDE